MRRSLHANFAGLQWVIDAYTLTLAALLLTGGSLADRLGRKRVFQAGLVVFTVASLVAGMSQSVLMLNLARAPRAATGVLDPVVKWLVGRGRREPHPCRNLREGEGRGVRGRANSKGYINGYTLRGPAG